MDRLAKRSEGVAADHARMAVSLASMTEVSADTYATDTNDVPLLNDGLVAMSKRLKTAQGLLEDESKAWETGVLEDLKRQRDALVSVREMFDRRERLDKDNIPTLERRIQNNETKLAGLRAKPEGLVKPGEVERVVESIIKVCIGKLDKPVIHTANSRHRTRKALSTSTTAPSLSARLCAMSSSISSKPSTRCHAGTRTGLKSASNTPRCLPTTGAGSLTSSMACHWESSPWSVAADCRANIESRCIRLLI